MINARYYKVGPGCLLPLLGLLCLLVSGPVSAVSLGDELILSRLGDPVEVEIEVLQWSELDLDQIQISAGSPTEYSNFGLVWQPVLGSLNFNMVGPDRAGQVRVLISSREPLDEPFLELLVVMRWPGGSLLREYILLFDPPASLSQGSSPATSPSVTEQPAGNPVVMLGPPVLEEDDEELSLANVDSALEETPLLIIPESGAPDLEVGPEPNSGPVVITTEGSAEAELVAAPAPSETLPLSSNPLPVPVRTESAPPSRTVPVRQSANQNTSPPDYRSTVAIEVESVAARRAARPGEGQTGRRTYVVQADDSLWALARQEVPRGEEADWYRYMLALFEINNGAFLNTNIALLKQGEQLQLPSNTDLARIDREGAQARFEQRWSADTFTFNLPIADEPPVVAQEPPPVEPVRSDIQVITSESDTVQPLLQADSNTVILAINTPVTREPQLPVQQPVAAPEQFITPEPAIAVTEELSAPAPQEALAAINGVAGAETGDLYVNPPEPVFQPAQAIQPEPALDEIVDEGADIEAIPAAAEPVPLSANQTNENIPQPEIQNMRVITVIQTKQQRLAELEELVTVMRVHARDAQEVAARLKTAVEDTRQGPQGMALNVLAGVLLLALIAAAYLLLRMHSQFNSLHGNAMQQRSHALVRKRRRQAS